MASAKRQQKIKDDAAQMKASAQSIVIQQPTILSVTVEVEGTADLIQNRFSQKAVEQMLRKHMGISVQREKKKPREVLEDATIYNLEGRVSIPPTAFKLAMINAASQLKGLKKTELKTALFVQGQSVPIQFEQMIPRMDIARLSGIGRTPDVRFRPSFRNWRARLTVLFSDTLSLETVIDLLQRAGKVGVGEWRPQKNGDFGTFRIRRAIETIEEQAEVEAQCAVPLQSLQIPSWALDAEIDPEVLSKIFAEQGVQDQETAPIA